MYVIRKSSPYRAVNTISVTKTSQLMLYREVIAGLRSTQNTQIHCGQNGGFLNVESGGPYSGHSAVRGLLSVRHE